MKIIFEKDNTEKNIDFNGTCAELLDFLKINSEEVLIVVNGELSSLDDICENDAEVKILSVVSGG